MKFKTWRDPYDAGFSPTKPKEIELKPGLTVLVGCNGAGKTTLLLNIKEVCSQNKIPCLSYDNLHDGGHNGLSEMFSIGNYEEGAYLFCASEGECIKANVGRKSKLYQEFIEQGFVKDMSYRFLKAFGKNDDTFESKDRVFLFDAVDSGLSVDSVVEMKLLFDQMMNDYRDSDKNLYIIIAANEYELAREADCFDVNKGKYIRFSDYEDYRNFIIKSRQRKEARLLHQKRWYEKQKEKELKKYYKIVSKQKELLNKLEKEKQAGNEVSPWDEDDIKNMVKKFLRSSRYITKEDIE